MKPSDWSRRHFLAASTAASLVTLAPAPAAAELTAAPQNKALLVVMDELIPAGENGFPSASEAGGLQYIERLMRAEPQMAKLIQGGLETLQAFSFRRFELAFENLPQQHRIATLEQIEREAPGQFAILRDTVYESYYMNPAIWKLIGYTPYPTDHRGPHMQPFDESLLAEVRKRPKLYREA